VKTLRWLVWGLGCLATILLVVGIGFMQAGPDWYLPVFVVAAIYCTLAASLSGYLRWKRSDDPRSSAWLEAMSTGRLGFLAVLATAAFIIVRVAVALVRR
jgi:hypothetical protein